MSTNLSKIPVAPPSDVYLRRLLRATDVHALEALLTATGMFAPHEVEVALELVHDFLSRGELSGYWFTVAEDDAGRVVGYTAIGPIPCTVASYDIYWIAVQPDCQGCGIGRRLMEEAEERIRAAGGARVFIDTSGRAQYAPTRAFYERCGYRVEATLCDFYAPGDDKVVYGKVL
ncbi:MAG: N-acetyltransferase [Phycisphaerales bacterium]|nr:MAG: N-acetyltransferase [Phycisphaerales bacterium]